MSVSPVRRSQAAESVAGILASLALFAAAIGIVYRPVRVVPAAIVVALVAAAVGGRHSRLAAAAVAAGAVAFVVGVAIASATGRPLW